MYILERDSTNIYQFDITNLTVNKLKVNIPQNFQHNFAYVQTDDKTVYLVGGGNIKI